MSATLLIQYNILIRITHGRFDMNRNRVNNFYLTDIGG